MIAIIVPEVCYVDYVLKESNYERLSESYEIYKCCHENTDFIIVATGYGKINIVSSLEYLISKYEISEIIQIGTSGSMDESKLDIFDVFIPSSTLEYDVDFTLLGQDPVTLPNEKSGIYMIDINLKNKLIKGAKYLSTEIYDGIIGSGDSFNIIKQYPNTPDRVKAIDNESGAVGHFASNKKIPFGVIKVISYIAGPSAVNQYKLYNDEATLKCQKIILNTLR